MEFKFPKNDEKYFWTNHVGRKMLYYGLSPDRVKRVIRSPYRSEKGIAPNTIAVMQPSSAKAPMGKAWKDEIWVMYAQKESRRLKVESGKKPPSTFDSQPSKKIVITAWRYPGISPVRDEIPIPIDILEELKREGMIIKS